MYILTSYTSHKGITFFVSVRPSLDIICPEYISNTVEQIWWKLYISDINNEIVHLLFWLNFLIFKEVVDIFPFGLGVVLCFHCPEYVLKTIYSSLRTDSLFPTIQCAVGGGGICPIRTVLVCSNFNPKGPGETTIEWKLLDKNTQKCSLNIWWTNLA